MSYCGGPSGFGEWLMSGLSRLAYIRSSCLFYNYLLIGAEGTMLGAQDRLDIANIDVVPVFVGYISIVGETHNDQIVAKVKTIPGKC